MENSLAPTLLRGLDDGRPVFRRRAQLAAVRGEVRVEEVARACEVFDCPHAGLAGAEQELVRGHEITIVDMTLDLPQPLWLGG